PARADGKGGSGDFGIHVVVGWPSQAVLSHLIWTGWETHPTRQLLGRDWSPILLSYDAFSPASTPNTSFVSFGSAAFAVAMILGTLAGSRASGRHMSVTIEKPTTLRPQWTATRT